MATHERERGEKNKGSGLLDLSTVRKIREMQASASPFVQRALASIHFRGIDESVVVVVVVVIIFTPPRRETSGLLRYTKLFY